jgi:hypothetical protein
MRRLCIALATSVLLFGTGCTSGTGVRWYAPATWPVFSGASKIQAAENAENRTNAARTQLQVAEREATHSAHLEFHKAYLSALRLPREQPAAALTLRTLGNGLGLLAQFDPLTAEESAAQANLVADLLSEDAKRVARAQAAQAAAERNVTEISRKLTEAERRIEQLEQAERHAQVRARTAALENLELANELRASRARFWILTGVAVLVLGFAVYARLALGGVGAALHAAGAPAAVIRELDANLSTFGQWLVRTGRESAAKTEAAMKARLTAPDQS